MRICEAIRAFSLAKLLAFGSTFRLLRAIALPFAKVLSASTSAGLTEALRPRLTKEMSSALMISKSSELDVTILLPFL